MAATVDFWQVRPPKWWPHHWRAAASATIFYCTKSRQNQGLVGLTSCGGPGSFDLEKNLALKSPAVLTSYEKIQPAGQTC